MKAIRICGKAFTWIMPALIFSLIISGCSEYKVINSNEYQIIKKVLSGEYELINVQELNRLRKEAEIGKGVGRYQMYTHGVRTWRLDTVTGSICLLLTTDTDWKKKETQLQMCSPNE